MRGDPMAGGYRQQPGASSGEVRKDGKRVAGKQKFPPPGSGGSRPKMAPRDLDSIPESVGGKEPQPAGSHIHDRYRTGTEVGKPRALVDSHAKVTGQAWYGDDVRLPNEIIGKILRSPHHYAKIKSIDTSKVEALPGVLAVATGADAPNTFGVLPVTKDEHAMAVEKVRHVGDLVACVAAVDEATAMEALNLFEIEWEVLDPVFDPRKIGRPRRPIHWRGKYHVGTTNVQKRVFQEFGDRSLVDDPTASSHGKWRMEGVHHGFTEPHAVVAHWDPNGRFSSTHRNKCRIMRIEHFQRSLRFRCIKSTSFAPSLVEDLVANPTHSRTRCCSHLSRKAGRPVRINFSREEVYLDQSRPTPKLHRSQDDGRRRGSNFRL